MKEKEKYFQVSKKIKSVFNIMSELKEILKERKKQKKLLNIWANLFIG